MTGPSPSFLRIVAAVLLCAGPAPADFLFGAGPAATFTRPLERVSTMDPAFATSLYDSRAIGLVFETPLDVDYTARPYRLVPGCCELPEMSADGRTYVFRMRRGAALGAEDVVRSLERLRDPKLVSPNGWMMRSVATLAVSNGAVVARLSARCHYFPWLMAMQSAAVRRADGTGTGPYELVSWRKNHAMEFRLRGGTEMGFGTVRYLVVDDVSTQWLMFLKGELDYLGEVSRDNWDAILDDLPADATEKGCAWLPKIGAYLHTYPTVDAMYVGINMRDAALGNRKLRQALNAAFDYPAWEEFYRRRIVPANGPVPPGIAGRVEEPAPYAFDLAKARRLMAEAGYPDGIDPKTGRRLVLTLANGHASQDARESGELLASFYAKIGIRLENAFYTWDAFLRAVNDGRVQLYRMGWVGDYPDAQNFLQLFYGPNASPGPNHGNYANAAFDRAYESALAAETEEARNACWRTCQEIVREDCPWIFTHFNRASVLVRPRVGNFIPSAFGAGNERHYRPR